MSEEKLLLRKLGLETIYTAKGHFKSSDIRRNLVKATIWSCAILNAVSLIGLNSIAERVMSFAGLCGTIALLLWNQGKEEEYSRSHKDIGEKYLALHKEIRNCFFLNACAENEVRELSAKVTSLDTSNKPDISAFGKYLAKKAIENSDPETDNWFN